MTLSYILSVQPAVLARAGMDPGAVLVVDVPEEAMRAVSSPAFRLPIVSVLLAALAPSASWGDSGRELERDETSVPAYVVADAWDGEHIREALQVYFQMAAGGSAETIEVHHGPETLDLRAGGAAHLLAYVGHNGLMEFSLESSGPTEIESPARSAMVLACASKSYFLDHLRAANAHPLLLTTGLMAPEAYTLDSAIRAWVGDGTTSGVVQAAAAAYDQYQHCGLAAARRRLLGRTMTKPAEADM